jgi:hypothetical protein
MSRKGRVSPLVRTRPNSRPSRLDASVDEHRRCRCSSAERVSEHADAAEVESAGEHARSRERRELGEHEPGVGNAYRERSRDAHLRGRDDDVSVGELNDGRVMRWSIATTTYPWLARSGEAGVEPAFDAETGREENNRPAATTLQRRRVGGRVELHFLQKCGSHSTSAPNAGQFLRRVRPAAAPRRSCRAQSRSSRQTSCPSGRSRGRDRSQIAHRSALPLPRIGHGAALVEAVADSGV